MTIATMPPMSYTSTESAGWRARMRGEPRQHPGFTKRRYVRQWNHGWDAADAQLKRVGAI